MADVAVTRPAGADPRIHIWGALEARLQSVDLLILGGLDEGVWPAETRTDPWLSRAMRAGIGLPPPERRIGLAAHDFLQGLAAPRVIVTRAEKRGGAPTVASRWLQRLRALVGKDAAAAMAARGDALRRIARARSTRRRRRPRPDAASARRSRRWPRGRRSLSITEIETLIRDPYAIYAKHILRLEPLDPLGRPPDGALRGTLIHEALGDFTEEWRGRYDAAAEARLLAIGARGAARDRRLSRRARRVVDPLRGDRALVRWLGRRRATQRVAKRHAEIDGELDMPAPAGTFTLRGRADRIDLMQRRHASRSTTSRPARRRPSARSLPA